MSKEEKQEIIVEPPKIVNEVTIGERTFLINRDIKWGDMRKLTKDLEDINKGRTSKEGISLIELGRRSDDWAYDVLVKCLKGFDDSALDDIAATKDYVNTLAASVYWATRSGTSFLLITSNSSSSTKDAKASGPTN